MKVIDRKKPLTGELASRTRTGMPIIFWHNQTYSALSKKDLKAKFYGKLRYEFIE